MTITKRKFLVAFVGGSLLAVPAAAQFMGLGGTLVLDLSNLAKNTITALKMAEEVEQTYQKLKLAIRMAKQIPGNLERFRFYTRPWRLFQTEDLFARNAGWANAVNTGLGALGGWRTATYQVAGEKISISVTGVSAQRYQTAYNAIELTDASATHTMEVLGRIRNNSNKSGAVISALQDDTYGGAEDLHSEIAELQKANAIMLLNAQAAQDQNEILSAMAQQSLVDEKRKRDAETRAFENEVAFQNQEKALLDAQRGNPSAAMMNWKFP